MGDVLIFFKPVDANDNAFWAQFWTDVSISVQDIFVLIPAAEIRALREESPNNLATLCYKAVELTISKALNCIRLLTRILPYIFEDPEWRSFFWSALPSEPESAVDDLLFCPDFTVHSISKSGPVSELFGYFIQFCNVRNTVIICGITILCFISLLKPHGTVIFISMKFCN
ncbi:unnamed protein product [Echinostoma caproni]|uniref:HID1 domain containing n=1 Tax=Echinostoma caproni TaxID=27848 RepID=A0A183BDW9_9TREM|nr:unnamed protein product [Echinostoma caproni]